MIDLPAQAARRQRTPQLPSACHTVLRLVKIGVTIPSRMVKIRPDRRSEWFHWSESLRVWPSIGTDNPIPEEMDHCEIAARVPVMNEVKLLFPSEPCKPLQSRSSYVVLLIKEDVRMER